MRDEDNPPTLFPEQGTLESIQGSWWVAQTKTRQEKALARDLVRSGVAYFLPMYEVSRSSRGRSWKSTLPLFAGYVFVCGDEAGRLASLKTGRVLTMIAVADQRRLVDELTAVHRLIASGAAVDPYPALKRGSRCRVRSGPLQGIEGRVAQRRQKARFVVEISILGQGAAVTIDGDLLEPLD